MKFQELSINQTFTSSKYPESVCTKLKKFGGSCCTPAHNASIVTEGKKELKMLDEDLEVEPVEPPRPENPSEDVPPELSGFRKHPKPLKVIDGVLHDSDRRVIGGGRWGMIEHYNKEMESRMIVSQVKDDQMFDFKGEIYTIATDERRGGGKVPIQNVTTGEISRLPANTTVSIVEETDPADGFADFLDKEGDENEES